MHDYHLNIDMYTSKDATHDVSNFDIYFSIFARVLSWRTFDVLVSFIVSILAAPYISTWCLYLITPLHPRTRT